MSGVRYLMGVMLSQVREFLHRYSSMADCERAEADRLRRQSRVDEERVLELEENGSKPA